MDQFQGAQGAATGYAVKGEAGPAAQSVSDVLQNTLILLTDVEEYAKTIRVRIHGSQPAEVAPTAALNGPPSLRQSAEFIRNRVGSLMHDLREIASVL